MRPFTVVRSVVVVKNVREVVTAPIVDVETMVAVEYDTQVVTCVDDVPGSEVVVTR